MVMGVAERHYRTVLLLTVQYEIVGIYADIGHEGRKVNPAERH